MKRFKSLFKKGAARPLTGAERPVSEINVGITNFVSVPIILSLVFLSSVLTYGHKTLVHFFVAGEFALNALICGGIVFSIAQITANVMMMRRTAKVLKDIEIVSQQDDISTEDIDHLHQRVMHKGHIVNTKQMSMVLDKMEVFGVLEFSNDEARLIKSKVGQRCSHNRTSVGFLAGLLIMMGLLGTYLGLLETIDEVGKAMASMANIGGSTGAPSGDGGLSDDQMSNFIGSIAAPLQGMGLAFSASLFGIGGSLIVSYFNFLSGHVQNHFIENVGRWIDDRIPQPGAAAQKGAAAGAPRAGGNNDLTSWLSAFAQLSQKTHKKLGQLIIVMSHTVKLMAQQKGVSEQMGKRQGEISDSLTAIQQHVLDFKSQTFETSVKSEQHLRSVDRTLTGLATDNGAIKDASQSLSGHMKSINDQIVTLNEGVRSSAGTVTRDMKAILASIEAQEAISKTLANAIQDLRGGMDGFVNVEKAVVKSLQDFRTMPPAQNETEVANLVWQLNSLLEEMNEANEDKLAAIKDKDQDA